MSSRSCKGPRSASTSSRVEVVLVRGRERVAPMLRRSASPSSSPRAATSASRRSSVHARVAFAIRASSSSRSMVARVAGGRRGARSATGRAPTRRAATFHSWLARAECLGEDLRRCVLGRASCTGHEAGTRGTTRSGRRSRGARTCGPAAAPATGECPSRSRTASRHRSGRGRRGDTSRESRAGPCGRGSREGTRPGRRRQRPSAAAQARRAASSCTPTT